MVEDDETIRRLVVTLLDEEGYDTDEAGDGLSALEKVRGSVPDLVLLDLFMPRMDGFEFLNVSRLLKDFAATPVVILSAGSQVPTDNRIKAFLKKPFDLNALSALVSSLLKDTRREPGGAYGAA